MKKALRNTWIVFGDLALALVLTKLWYVFPKNVPRFFEPSLTAVMLAFADNQEDAADVELLCLIFVAFVFFSVITWDGLAAINVAKKRKKHSSNDLSVR